MFTRLRQRKVPRGGHQSPLQLLVDHAEIQVKATGTTSEPAGPWIAGAELWLKLQSNFRPLASHETPELVVEDRLATRGLQCRWEADGLVITLPAWTPPPQRLVDPNRPSSRLLNALITPQLLR